MSGRGRQDFKFKNSNKRNHDFDGGSNNQRKQFNDFQDDSNNNRNHHNKVTDNGNEFGSGPFVQVSKPEKPRKYTVSIAVPASILEETSIKDELQTCVVGQIARAAVIYSVDEIVVYDDGFASRSGYHRDSSKSKLALDKMRMLLEYQETPQYLRKYFFGFHKNLRCVGLLNPLNSAHHLKNNEWCEYRDGVVHEGSKESTSYADIGLRKNILIDRKLKAGVRVTVKLSSSPPDNPNDLKSISPAKVVSPNEPRAEGGYYWGYSVRVANCLSQVVNGSKFPEGYDLVIGTSDKGEDAKKVKYHRFSHALIVFGGVDGIEAAIEADPQLKGYKPLDLFPFYVNTCVLQQVRTIRTEEAVLISLCTMHDKLSSRGIQ